MSYSKLLYWDDETVTMTAHRECEPQSWVLPGNKLKLNQTSSHIKGQGERKIYAFLVRRNCFSYTIQVPIGVRRAKTRCKAETRTGLTAWCIIRYMVPSILGSIQHDPFPSEAEAGSTAEYWTISPIVHMAPHGEPIIDSGCESG